MTRRMLLYAMGLSVLTLASGCATQATRITSEPPGATITYNGRYIGETPVSCTVKQKRWWSPNNTYTFAATKDGYRADTKICEEHFGEFVDDVVPPQIHFDLQPMKAEKSAR